MFTLTALRNSFAKIYTHRPIHLVAALKSSQINEVPKLETRDITKDRTQVIPLDTSLRYLKSEAYRQTYGGQPVWVLYRYCTINVCFFL